MWLQVPQSVGGWLVVTGVPLGGGAILQQEQGDRQNLVTQVEISVQNLQQMKKCISAKYLNSWVIP